MWKRHRFEDLFQTRYPIVQGPMNNASPPALVSAVSGAGGLGFLAASLLAPAAIDAAVGEIRRRTAKPFGVNLFVLPEVTVRPAQLEAAMFSLEPYRRLLGLPPATVPVKFCESFREQFDALLDIAPPVVSFTLGIVDPSAVRRLHEVGSKVIGTATTVAEARAWEAAGADAICAQGSEAGGHRATFLGAMDQSCVGLMALLPQMRPAVGLPIIAAGGIMTGRATMAAMMLGADAVQLGSAFLHCPEAGINATWKAHLASARDDSTRLSRSFSGRHARGIVNRYMRETDEHGVPDYPIQNALTAELRAEAGRLGRGEFMSLWAGQAAGMGRSMPAGELVRTLAAEADEAARWIATLEPMDPSPPRSRQAPPAFQPPASSSRTS